MGRKFIRFVTILLSAVIYLSGVGSAADAGADGVIRVGLFYGENALPGVNLENSVGSGYRLGYYDGSYAFTQLGYTAETQISMVKTQNVTLSGGNYVDGTGGVTVGCFHLQLPLSYATFEDAQAGAAGVPNGFPAWTDGVYSVRAGAYPSKEEALSALAGLGYGGAQVVGTSGYAVTVVATKTGRPLFQFDGGASQALGVRPDLSGGADPVTWCRGYRYYGGFQYLRSGGNLTVLNIVSLEDCVKGVLPYEMNNDWPLEALKAQAVCARTYAFAGPNHKSAGFDVCNNTHCQMYQGLNRANTLTDRAVEDTTGQFVWYNGKMAVTYYSACDGGATEDVRNIWDPTADMPHLVGVTDPYEADLADGISQYHWTVTVTKASAAEILRSKNQSCAAIVDAYITEQTPTGNPKSVTFVDANGKHWTIGPESVRIWFGLRSNRFTIGSGGVSTENYYVNGSADSLPSLSGAYAVDGQGNVTPISGAPYAVSSSGTAQAGGSTASSGTGTAGSSITFSGSGHGHNVGMSQQGARAMALRGMDYMDILTFYFTGVDIR